MRDLNALIPRTLGSVGQKAAHWHRLNSSPAIVFEMKSDISLPPTSPKRWSNANLNVHNDKDGLGKGKERSHPRDDVADDVADHSLTGDNSWQ